jgi:hypothetical protein
VPGFLHSQEQMELLTRGDKEHRLEYKRSAMDQIDTSENQFKISYYKRWMMVKMMIAAMVRVDDEDEDEDQTSKICCADRGPSTTRSMNTTLRPRGCRWRRKMRHSVATKSQERMNETTLRTTSPTWGGMLGKRVRWTGYPSCWKVWTRRR